MNTEHTMIIRNDPVDCSLKENDPVDFHAAETAKLMVIEVNAQN